MCSSDLESRTSAKKPEPPLATGGHGLYTMQLVGGKDKHLHELLELLSWDHHQSRGGTEEMVIFF